MPEGPAVLGSLALAGLVRPASAYASATVAGALPDDAVATGDIAAGGAEVLPVAAALGELLPRRGMRRGASVHVTIQPGGHSLLMALLAAASATGAWCAVLGLPGFGAVAAAEAGLVLDRLALVPHPGPDWVTIAAALIDGVDVLALAVPAGAAVSVTGRLAARARQRGCVLVPYGPRWDSADVTLRVRDVQWQGLGEGRGRLQRRQVVIAAGGRGAAARPRTAAAWLPAPDGSCVLVDSDAATTELVTTRATARSSSAARLHLRAVP